MVDLKCERQNCKFNKSCNCTADDIDVASSTECTTYQQSDNPAKHEKDRIPQALVRHNTNVRCKAECLFARDCECIANGITIENLDLGGKCDCPACCTFLPK